MQPALISCDFLLAPAYCDPNSIEYRVASLIELLQSLNNLEKTPLLEADSMNKLIAAEKYPCERLFIDNLQKSIEPIYSGKDIAKIINKILSEGQDFSSKEEILWENQEREVLPNFKGTNVLRNTEMSDLVEEISVYNAVQKADISILHYCPINNFDQIQYSTIITELIPCPNEISLPYHLNHRTKIFQDYRNFLATVQHESVILDNPENSLIMEEAFFYGSLRHLKQQGKCINDFERKKFSLGDSFMESLKQNQCLLGQKFFNTLFSCVVSLLTEDSNFEINLFYTSDKKDQQRTSGQFKAFRAHVTKSGVGLRLLFWKTDTGYIELANVGPKFELKIAPPTTQPI